MKLERKNKNLKENLDIERRWHLQLARRVKQLEEENKKLKETIKDHQLYEEKLEHRIIELEELLHWE